MEQNLPYFRLGCPQLLFNCILCVWTFRSCFRTLTQQHDIPQGPIAYHNLALYPRAKTYSPCLSTIACWDKVSKSSSDFIKSFVYIKVSHQILLNKNIWHFSPWADHHAAEAALTKAVIIKGYRIKQQKKSIEKFKYLNIDAWYLSQFGKKIPEMIRL